MPSAPHCCDNQKCCQIVHSIPHGWNTPRWEPLTHSSTHSGSAEAVYQLSQCLSFWTRFWNMSSLLASELWQKAGLFISETYPILNYLKRSYFSGLSSLLLFALEALGLFPWRRMKTRFLWEHPKTPAFSAWLPPPFGERAKLPLP